MIAVESEEKVTDPCAEDSHLSVISETQRTGRRASRIRAGRISQRNTSWKELNVAETLQMFSRRLPLNLKFKHFDQSYKCYVDLNNHTNKRMVEMVLNIH